jgi:type IV pilus assembly protein PilO
MTFSDEFIPMEEPQEAPPPPGSIVFAGVVLTPKIQGIAFGVLGAALAGVLVWKLLLPALSQNQELKASIDSKTGEIEATKERVKRLEAARNNLEEVKQRKENVLALFSQQGGLETLLLDINAIVKPKQGAKLELFKPQEKLDNAWIFEAGAAGGNQAAANQSSGGAEGDNAAAAPTAASLSLSQAIEGTSRELKMQGNFEQTRETLRDIERLQQLIAIDQFTSELTPESQKIFVDPSGQITGQETPKLNTSFKLLAIVPKSQEELQKLAAPPPPKEEGEGEENQ